MTKQEARQRMLRMLRDDRNMLGRMRQEGYRDYVRGKQDGCPYPKDSDEQAAWTCGYFDAVEDHS